VSHLEPINLAVAELLSKVGDLSVFNIDSITGIASELPDDEQERIVHILRAREQRLNAMCGGA